MYDYAAYVGGRVDYGHVPIDEFDLYALRASEAIDAATMYKIPLFYKGVSSLSAFQAAQLIQACCAQAEYYGLIGIDSATDGSAVSSYSIGKTQVSTTPGRAPSGLCPAARKALAMTGLLYAGIAVCDN